MLLTHSCIPRFVRLVVQVELRRARLADRGRLHRQFVRCPAECGDSFLQKNVKMHLAYQCKMRTVTCSMAACGKQILAKDVRRYDPACNERKARAYMHPCYLVFTNRFMYLCSSLRNKHVSGQTHQTHPLRIFYGFCPVISRSYTARLFLSQTHNNHQLLLVAIICRHLHKYCASYKTWIQMAQAGYEKQETCECPKCSETLRRCNLKLHLKYVCQWVRDPCRNLGCGALIPRLRLAEHERRFCGALSAVRKHRRLARARARSNYHRQWAQHGE